MFLGLLLFIIGIVWLGLDASWWTPDQVEKLYKFWPVLLILLGLSLIIKPRKIRWAVNFVFWLIFLLAIIFLVFSPWTPITSFRQEPAGTKNFNIGLTSFTKDAKISINVGAIDLNISDSATDLLDGTFTSNNSNIEVSSTNSNNSTQATIDMKGARLHLWRGVQNNMDLHLNPNIPLEIDLDSGASDLELDLSNIILKKLSVDFGASSLDLKLGQKILNNAEINISGGASSINIEVPQSIGVRIETNNGLTSENFANYNKINNDTYESKNYDQAAKKIKINLSTGVSSINISTY